MAGIPTTSPASSMGGDVTNIGHGDEPLVGGIVLGHQVEEVGAWRGG